MGPKSHCSIPAYTNMYKHRAATQLFKRQSKNRVSFKIIELLLFDLRPPGQDPGAKTRPQEQLECANLRGSPGGDGQAWN